MPIDILNAFRTLINLIKKYRDPELVDTILELQNKVRELTTLCEKLKEQVSLKDSIQYKAPFFYKDDGKDPLCPNCWQAEGMPFYMIQSGNMGKFSGWKCPRCHFYHNK